MKEYCLIIMKNIRFISLYDEYKKNQKNPCTCLWALLDKTMLTETHWHGDSIHYNTPPPKKKQKQKTYKTLFAVVLQNCLSPSITIMS